MNSTGRGRGRGRATPTIGGKIQSLAAPAQLNMISTLKQTEKATANLTNAITKNTNGIAKDEQIPSNDPVAQYFLGESHDEGVEIGDQEQMACRPGIGKRGIKVDLITNWKALPLQIHSDFKIFRYHVNVSEKYGNNTARAMVVKKNRLQKEEDRRKCYELFLKFFEIETKKDGRGIFGQNGVESMAYDRHTILIACCPLNFGHESKVRLSCMEKAADGTSVTYQFEIEFVNSYMMKQFCENQLKQRDEFAKLKNDNISFLQTLDIMLNNWFYLCAHRKPSSFKFVTVGSSFYEPYIDSGNCVDLGDGRVLYSGISKQHKVVAGNANQPVFALNIDLAHTAFYKYQPVAEYMKEIFGKRSNFVPPKLSRDQYNCLVKKLKGRFVESSESYVCLRWKFCVDGISKFQVPASELKFHVDGKEYNVEEYYSKRYGIKLRFPHWPCAEKHVFGRAQFYPLELLYIAANQRVSRGHATDETLTRKMIEYAGLPPDERLFQLKQMITKLDIDNDKLSEKFGIRRDSNLMKVTGRIIQAPTIEYKNCKINPKNGVWLDDEAEFVMSGLCEEWALVCFNTRISKNVVYNFANAIVAAANRKGLKMPQDPCIHWFAERGTDYSIEHILKAVQVSYRTCTAFMCLIVQDADTNNDSHDEIKRCSERCFDFITQCVKPKTAMLIGEDYNPKNCRFQTPRVKTTAVNIANKINSKLGGINFAIAEDFITRKFMHKRVLIVGADVTHPPPQSKVDHEKGILGEPSISVLSAPRNSHYQNNYFSSARVQNPGEEYLIHIKSQMMDIIREWRESNKGLPDKLIFYRDGVAEGMYLKILQFEIPNIRRACQLIGQEFNCPGFEPELMYVIVTKRHHTRFFKAEFNRQLRKNADKNIAAGTVVDTGPVHPTNYEFFLCSHQGIQATSKPCKYVVLVDDLKIDPDELQQLTYHLCHGMARCTRAISYPIPVYHAHLACEHYKNIWRAEVAQCDSSSSGFSSGSDASDGSVGGKKKEIDYSVFQDKITIESFCLKNCPWA